MSERIAFQTFRAFARQAYTTTTSSISARFSQHDSFTNLSRNVFRRNASTAATGTVVPPGGVNQNKFQQFLHSEVGPKTVHFWAPIMKWGLVIAGAADFARPASALSLSQNAALTATGAIWTRWCLIIKPRNVFLASVNFALACVGATQVTRVLLYQQEMKNKGVVEEVKDAARSEGRDLKDAVTAIGKNVTK